MSYQSKLYLSFICLWLSACTVSKEESKTPNTPAQSASNPTGASANAESLTQDEVIVGENKIGTIQKKNFDSKAIDLQKKKFANSSLEPISVNPKLNASVYRMPTNENRAGFFVSPRLMVYGGKKLNALAKTSDGMVNIPFNVAIIDGLRNFNASLLSDFSNVKVPEDLVVTDYQELKNNIVRTSGYSKDFEISALPGCMTKATIFAAGKTFDVTPEDVNNYDYCEMNKAFTLNLKTTEAMANYLLSDGMNSGAVDLAVGYGIMAQVPVSQITINFDRAKLTEELKMRLSLSNPPYSKGFLETAIKSIIADSNLDIYVVGKLDKAADEFVSKAIAELFTSFSQSPNDQNLGECKDLTCFDFSKLGSKTQGSFSVSWNQMQSQKVEKFIRISSKLKPIDDTTKLIGSDNRVPSSNQIEFSNKNSNPVTNPDNTYGTNFLPVKGSVFEMMPLKLVWERRARDKEIEIGNYDFNDCTGRDWKGSCTYTFKTLREMSLEYKGDDIWEEVREVQAKIPKLYSMIYVQFTFANARKLECPIESLNGYSVDNVRGFTIENSENCKIFETAEDRITSFALINRAALDPQKYKAGTRMVASHQGGYDRYVETTYNPEIHLSLNLKLLGNGFVSKVNIE